MSNQSQQTPQRAEWTKELRVLQKGYFYFLQYFFSILELSTITLNRHTLTTSLNENDMAKKVRI
jgi:hypothetical protein